MASHRLALKLIVLVAVFALVISALAPLVYYFAPTLPSQDLSDQP